MTSLLLAHLHGRQLVPVARLRTRREGLRAYGAEIVEDNVAVLDGVHVIGRFRELEVELLEGDERTLRRLEKELRNAGAESRPLRPKLFRALDLGEAPQPVVIAKDVPPLEAVALALAEQHRRMLLHDPGTRLGADAEDLHQLRVATRRARAFLRVARPIVDHAWAESLRGELAWLGSSLGPARDADVQLETMRAEVEALEEDAGGGGGLVAELATTRDGARGLLVEALSSDRYLALLAALDTIEPGAVPQGERAGRWPRSGWTSGVAHTVRRGSWPRALPTRSCTRSGSVSSACAMRPSSLRTSSAASMPNGSAPQPRSCKTCSASIRTQSSPKSGFVPGRGAMTQRALPPAA